MGCVATSCGRCIDCCFRRRHSGKPVELRDIEDSLQTGDLLIYAANTFVPPKIAQCTPWCHAAVVYRHPTSNRLYIFESEASITFDEGTNPKNGVLLAPIRWMFSNAYGRDSEGMILIRKLDDPNRSKEDTERVEKYIADSVMKPFDYEQGFGAVCDSYCVFCCRCTLSEEERSEMFCSESVAYFLQELGVLSTEFPGSSYSPGDLAEMTDTWLCGCNCNRLPMERGATYTRNLLLVNPATQPASVDGWEEYWPENTDPKFVDREIELTRKDINELLENHKGIQLDV